jgi:hypothetical protein
VRHVRTHPEEGRGRIPRKAEPGQSVFGEGRETVFGADRVYEEKEFVTWRAPRGYHFENRGSCSNRVGDDGGRIRVCIWKVVEDQGDGGAG